MYYVAFVDILGFAQQVESLDQDGFQAICRFWEQKILPPFESPAYKLAMTYDSFQHFFDEYQRYSALDGSRRTPSAVVDAFLFSDSAFVATTDALDLLNFCRSFFRVLMHSHVPVRAGIGAGSFASFDIETRRAAGGHVFVRCPFLGSGVVRAYRAESSGLRGLRCFVHPSFIQGTSEGVLEELIELEESDQRPAASHEVDLFWSPIGFDLNDVRETIKYLSEMRQASTSDKAHYYDDTIAAFYRMWRRQLSEAPDEDDPSLHEEVSQLAKLVKKSAEGEWPLSTD
jgi:hypothetical protein